MAGTLPDRIVLDTNNILSLFFAEEYDFFVYLKLKHQIELFTCKQQIEELNASFSYSKVRKLLKTEPEKLIGFFRKYSTTVKIFERFDRISDLKDNYLIDMAYTVKANYLVSGDREVLALKHIGAIQIISITYLRQLLQMNQ
jgi:putative PIN family toxin of toxin-antitoxin system